MEKINIPVNNSLDSMEGIQNDELGALESIKSLASVFSDVKNLHVMDMSQVLEQTELGKEYEEAVPVGMSPANFSGFVQSAIEDPNNKEVVSVLKRLCSGKVIIDFGPGDNALGYEIAERLGASAYIAVEPFFARNLISELNSRLHANMRLPCFVLNTDAFNVLSNMITGSANVMSIGTDSEMIRDKEYRNKVNHLLYEKIGTNIFIGSETVFHPEPSKEILRFYSHRGGVGLTEVYGNQ